MEKLCADAALALNGRVRDLRKASGLTYPNQWRYAWTSSTRADGMYSTKCGQTDDFRCLMGTRDDNVGIGDRKVVANDPIALEIIRIAAAELRES